MSDIAIIFCMLIYFVGNFVLVLLFRRFVKKTSQSQERVLAKYRDIIDSQNKHSKDMFDLYMRELLLPFETYLTN